jgi:hypothetical protein
MSTSTVLNACRLENVSKKLILKSYTNFNDADYKLPGNEDSPDKDLASAAVISEMIMHSFRTHKTLQARFTHHALNSEGHNVLVNLTHKTVSRDIGFTELKKITTPAIVIALASPVYDFILSKYDAKEDEGILIQLQKTHSYELPWHPILCRLHQCRKLGNLVYYLHSKSRIQPPACYEDPVAASSYVGYCIYLLIVRGLVRPVMAIRSYLSKESTVQEYNMGISVMRMTLLKKMFLELVSGWVPNTDELGLRMNITRRAVYTVLCEIDTDALADHIKDHVKPNSLEDVAIYRFLEFDPVMMEMSLEDEYDTKTRQITTLKKKFPSWPWDSVLSEIKKGSINGTLIRQIERFTFDLKFRIGFCDIAAAIAVVRSDDVADDNDIIILDEDELANIKDLPPPPIESLKCAGVSKPIPDGVFLWRCRKGMQVGVKDHHLMDYDYSYDKIIFDEAHFLRIYGSHTTSQSKLDYIFSVTGTKKDLPKHVHILCAADGYGGFVEYLAHITSYSIFTFNTLLTTSGRNCLPYSAITVLNDRHHKVNNSLLDQGIDDLTTVECRNQLSNPCFPYTIVTCDADIKWEDHSKFLSILWNMISIYLKGSVPESILIVKVNMGKISDVVNACSYLRLYCRIVLLIRCPSSNAGGEIYLFAHHIKRTVLDPISGLHKANDEETRVIENFNRKSYDTFLATINKTQYTTIPELRRSTRVLWGDLNSSASSKMLTRLALDCDFKSLVLSYHYTHEVWKKVRDILTANQKLHWDVTMDPTKHRTKGIDYEEDTLTHRRICAMRVITSSGALWMIDAHQLTHTISKQNIRLEFNHVMARLPKDLRLFPFTAEVYKKTYNIHGVKMLSPYARFMDGIRLGQMMIGYVRHSRLRTRQGRETGPDLDSFFQ